MLNSSFMFQEIHSLLAVHSTNPTFITRYFCSWTFLEILAHIVIVAVNINPVRHCSTFLFLGAVFHGQPWFQESCVQHKEWNIRGRLRAGQCGDLMGAWRLHVLGICFSLSNPSKTETFSSTITMAAAFVPDLSSNY